MSITVVRRGAVAVALFAVVLMLASGEAFASAWSNAAGSNAAFGWSGGQNNTDHFGNPTVTDLGFYFEDPVDFRAEGGGGTGASITDFARVTVNVGGSTPAGAPPIDTIIVEEWGTWSADISEVEDFTVQADFSIIRFAPPPPGGSGSLSLPVTFNPDGTWYASRTLVAGAPGNPPVSDQPWINFNLTVTNTIQVNGGTAPAGSFIEKAGMRIIVPEPGTMMVVIGGLAPVLLRRRRR